MRSPLQPQTYSGSGIGRLLDASSRATHSVPSHGPNSIYLQAPHVNRPDEAPLYTSVGGWCYIIELYLDAEEDSPPLVDGMAGQEGSWTRMWSSTLSSCMGFWRARRERRECMAGGEA